MVETLRFNSGPSSRPIRFDSDHALTPDASPSLRRAAAPGGTHCSGEQLGELCSPPAALGSRASHLACLNTFRRSHRCHVLMNINGEIKSDGAGRFSSRLEL